MKDLGLLVLRTVIGSLLAGHGAQKLFGAFGGPGMEGTAGMMDKIGMRPSHLWAQAAGASELVGGLFTALGFMHPVGPMLMLGPMAVATRKVHWGKPIWNTAGGAELPVINIAAATTVLIAGPGVFSLDTIFRTRVGWRAFLLTVAGIGFGLWQALGQRAERPAMPSIERRERERRPVRVHQEQPVAV